MENDLSGRRPQWKMTSVEDDLSGRRPHWKMTSVDNNLSLQWTTTSAENNPSGKGPQWKMTLLAWNQQNRSTLVESETILKRWKTASMEDNINISSASAVKPT
jgi:hypothetical protein